VPGGDFCGRSGRYKGKDTLPLDAGGFSPIQNKIWKSIRRNMRKFHIASTTQSVSSEQAWLDLVSHAGVQITSEETGYPIESALEGKSPGWRAGTSGTQIVRLFLDKPHRLKHISLVFEDVENTRTQEFVLRWSPCRDGVFREIVRQQWNFSPSGSVREIENYVVELSEVLVLELMIVPDKSYGNARASMQSFRLAGDAKI